MEAGRAGGASLPGRLRLLRGPQLRRGSIFGLVGIGGPGSVVAEAWRYGQCGLTFRRGTQFANQRQPCAPTGSGETAVSNNVALNPSLLFLSRPNGQFTAPGKTSNALGTVLIAHFRF